MALKKALWYGALAIGVLILISVAVSLITTVLSLVWALVTTAISLLVLAAIVYGIYKGVTWLTSGSGSRRRSQGEFGTSTATSTTTTSVGGSTEDRLDRLREQYVNGEITEAEFERRIDAELDTGSKEREFET